MRQSQQKLVAADELLCHQTPETFATISHADISWTEKLWGSLFDKYHVDLALQRGVAACIGPGTLLG